MSTLLVYLDLSPPRSGADYDYALSADGHSVTQHGRASAAMLPAATEVVAVLAIQALSWHTLDLPKGTLAGRAGKASPRLRSVLEGMLEEQLLDDAPNLHFALAPGAHADAPVLVAVCARAPLRQALQELEAAGRTVARIVPEYEPSGDAEPAWHIGGSAQQAWLVHSSAQAVTCLPLSAASVSLARQSLRAQAEGRADTNPHSGDQAVTLCAEPAVAAQAEAFFKRPAQLLQREQRWLRAAASAWDLAQFDLVSSNQARTLKRLHQTWQAFSQAPQWRPARWGLALLLLVQVLGLNLWAWHEKAGLKAQHAELNGLLTQTFPGVRVVVDAPVQMEREVAALQRASGNASGADLEVLLAAAAGTLPAGRAASGVDYSGAQMRLKGLQLSGDEAQPLAAQLKAQGISARLEGSVWLLQAGGQP